MTKRYGDKLWFIPDGFIPAQSEGMLIPKGTPYALEVESNLPIIVQFSRMDATQPANTLMTTMAYPGNQI